MRVGKFTSSSIGDLMSKGRGNWTLENTGKPFDTLVKKKYWEARLGRTIDKQVNSKPLNWGNLVESYAFEHLPMDLDLHSSKRFVHDEISVWSGAPDYTNEKIVGDIKCPYTLQGFIELYEIIENKDLEAFKKEKSSYYWQLVSNSILTGLDIAEITVFIPKKSQLEEIREKARESIEEDQNKYAFVNWAEDNELPYLPDDCEIDNVSSFSFEVPEEDKIALYSRVLLAKNMVEEMLK